MTFGPFGGAEAGLSAANQGSGVYQPVTTDATIVAAPGAFPGAYSYSVAPLLGNGFDQYGWAARLEQPNLLSVMFRYRFTADWDAAVSICELGKLFAADDFARRLVQDTNEDLQIIDRAGNNVGTTPIGDRPFLTANTDYYMLWYVDLRVEAASRDILWVWDAVAGDWENVIDVSNHGFGDPANIWGVTFGSSIGKNPLPGDGGVFYVDEMCPQILNCTPNIDPIGSCTTAFLIPTGNGTDGDFDAGDDDGGGWGNPDWRNVEEIPPDGDTSYDEGGTTGDKQGYEVADPGNVPLALQVIGSGGEGAGVILHRTFILHDGTYDYSVPNHILADPAYRILMPLLDAVSGDVPKTYNEVNGETITEGIVDDCEVGVEIVSSAGGGTYRITQAGLETMIKDKNAPDDFPTLAEPRVVSVQGQPILGSANPMVI